MTPPALRVGREVPRADTHTKYRKTMKKTYIAPEISLEPVEAEQMMAFSIFDKLPEDDNENNKFAKPVGGLDIWGDEEED